MSGLVDRGAPHHDLARGRGEMPGSWEVEDLKKKEEEEEVQ